MTVQVSSVDKIIPINTTKVELELDIEVKDLIEQLDASDVLDAIGEAYCKEYFGLKSKDQE